MFWWFGDFGWIISVHDIYIQQLITGIGKALHWDGTRVFLGWHVLAWWRDLCDILYFFSVYCYTWYELHMMMMIITYGELSLSYAYDYQFEYKRQIESIFLLMNKKNFSSVLVFYDPQGRSTSPSPCPKLLSQAMIKNNRGDIKRET